MPFEGFGRFPQNGKKFRVVGVDTFANEDWLEGDFNTKEEAMEHAQEKGGTMLKMHVYDEKGKHVGEAGDF
ncbi:MAG: hypothetical protein M0P26_01005 [Bacteroidales bacterium]|nr:hypothetical protein [Bacteroidales bacterium]